LNRRATTLRNSNDPRDDRLGIQSVGPEGPQGTVTWIPDIEFEQPTYELGGRPQPTPHAPEVPSEHVACCSENPIRVGYRLVLPGEG
jgi:hypothetical protein